VRLKWHRNHEFTVCGNSFLWRKLGSLSRDYSAKSRDNSIRSRCYAALSRDNSTRSRDYAAHSREYTSFLFTAVTSSELWIVKLSHEEESFFNQFLIKIWTRKVFSSGRNYKCYPQFLSEFSLRKRATWPLVRIEAFAIWSHWISPIGFMRWLSAYYFMWLCLLYCPRWFNATF